MLILWIRPLGYFAIFNRIKEPKNALILHYFNKHYT